MLGVSGPEATSLARRADAANVRTVKAPGLVADRAAAANGRLTDSLRAIVRGRRAAREQHSGGGSWRRGGC